MLLDKPNGYSNNCLLYHDHKGSLVPVEAIQKFKVSFCRRHENLTRIYELTATSYGLVLLQQTIRTVLVEK